MSILSAGEVLWDVFAHRELLGGAPLNFSAMASRLGHDVTLLTAVGDDDRGLRALTAIRNLGLSTDCVQTIPSVSSGAAIVTTDSEGNASYRIDRPAAFDGFQLDEQTLARLQALPPSWLYFGTLAQAAPGSPALIESLRRRFPGLPRFYDINLREGHWNFPLVQRLSASARVLKLNHSEAELLHRHLHPLCTFSLESFCREWAAAHRIATICVTLGGEGCAILSEGRFQAFPGFSVKVADTVGAGDAFAAALLHGIIRRWPIEQTARFANAVGATVASQPGAIPSWDPARVDELIARS